MKESVNSSSASPAHHQDPLLLGYSIIVLFYMEVARVEMEVIRQTFITSTTSRVLTKKFCREEKLSGL